MASVVVSSAGALTRIDAPWSPYGLPSTSMGLYGEYFADYHAIYRTQPSIRKCVSFLARNLAQLGIHVFRRESDVDRIRLAEHPLAITLGSPFPAGRMTRYRLIDSTVNDIGIYDNAYWVKIPSGAADGSLWLVRIHPAKITPIGNWLTPDLYRIYGSAGELDLPVEAVVHFRGYNSDPAQQLLGLSPLETLRRSIAEDVAMGEYRERLWRHGARMEYVITRPADAPKWSGDAKDRFWARWNAQFTGVAGGGKTALLEEGMDIKPASFSAREAQYAESRQVNDEEAAAMYHIPLPMIGRLEHATFSNIKEQHAQLYQDTLGPWLVQLAEDIRLQLLTAFDDQDRVYLEFNIAEKMRGSFEDQADAASTATGGPWMTVNEQRARFNLPQVPGPADELIIPMNVTVGGQASPRDSAPPAGGQAARRRGAKALPGPLAAFASWVEQHTDLLTAYIGEQREAADGGDALAPADWNGRLSPQLLDLAVQMAAEVGGESAAAFGAEWDADVAAAWIEAHTDILADNINTTTADGLAAAAEDDVDGLKVEHWWGVRLDQIPGTAEHATLSTSMFAQHEGARQGGARSKTWHTHGANQRARHTALNGTTVGIEATFPVGRGARWPRDHKIGAVDQIAGCTCSLTYSQEEP